jgi:hypothetical protein
MSEKIFSALWAEIEADRPDVERPAICGTR